MNRKALLVLLFLPLPLFSCSKKDNKTIVDCDLVGELKHIQYWNKYDKWDLSSLSLVIKYDDNTEEQLNGDNPMIGYNFSPESPVGMEKGKTSFRIYNSYFTSENGEKYQIADREFNDITIIDYPYSNTPRELYDSGIINKYIFPIFIGAGLIGLSIPLLVKALRKREAKKDE